MNKATFLEELRNGLSGLSQEDINERIAFYAEMIDDRMEEGYSEEEAVAGIGSVSRIVSQAIADTPPIKSVPEPVTSKRSLRGGEIALLILGFPLWFPLLAAFGAVVLSLYIVVWVLIIALWVIEISLWVGTLGGLAAAVVDYVQGFPLAGTAMVGAALFCAGLALFLLFGCIAASKGIVWLTKKTGLWLKNRLTGKENTSK